VQMKHYGTPNRVVPVARGEAQRISSSQCYRDQVIAVADGGSLSFLRAVAS